MTIERSVTLLRHIPACPASEGRTTAEIAGDADMSAATVRKHLLCLVGLGYVDFVRRPKARWTSTPAGREAFRASCVKS